MAEEPNLPDLENDDEFVSSVRRSLGRTSIGERRRSNFLARDAEMRAVCGACLDPNASKKDNLAKIIETAIRLALKTTVSRSDDEDKEPAEEFEKRILANLNSVKNSILQNESILEALNCEEEVREQHSILHKRTQAIQEEIAGWKPEYNRRKQIIETAGHTLKAAQNRELVIDDSQASKLADEDAQYLKEKPNHNALLDRIKNYEDKVNHLTKKLAKDSRETSHTVENLQHLLACEIRKLDVSLEQIQL